MEQQIRDALDADFKEYLGIVDIRKESDYSKSVIIFGKSMTFKIEAEKEEDLPKLAWRAVAEYWLQDDTADHGEAKKNRFCYYDGSTRGVQNKNLPMPPEKSEKEMDIRWRLAFGKEIQ